MFPFSFTHRFFLFVILTSIFTPLLLDAQESSRWAAPTGWKPPVERKLYVGKNSTEAEMIFDFEVEIESNGLPTQDEAREKIEKQILHLFGPMGEADLKAVPKGSHTISLSQVSKKAANLYVAKYSYQGMIVLQNGPERTYPITLPINPDTIYGEGMNRQGTKNLCTDDHYNSEGDFWYFWNPNRPGCPLIENKHYAVISANITRLPNSKKTYPEYSRLSEDRSGEQVISIHMLMGLDDPNQGRNPLNSSDINAQNYRMLRKTFLEELRFTVRRWTQKEVNQICVPCNKPDPTQDDQPFVEEFTKKNKKSKLVIRAFFAPTGINEPSQAFHYFLKDAMENAAVMMYDGHSGLGGHLDLVSIEDMEGFKFQPKKNRYQIYFFNSCSSYTYYNTLFFARKRTPTDKTGKKSLDILTNGLATYFYVMHDTNLALISAIDAWTDGKGAISYQKLADEIDSGNLFGINGDEDQENPN